MRWRPVEELAESARPSDEGETLIVAAKGVIKGTPAKRLRPAFGATNRTKPTRGTKPSLLTEATTCVSFGPRSRGRRMPPASRVSEHLFHQFARARSVRRRLLETAR